MTTEDRYDWRVVDCQGKIHTIKSTGEPMIRDEYAMFVSYPESTEDDEDMIATFYRPASIIRGEKVSG